MRKKNKNITYWSNFVESFLLYYGKIYDILSARLEVRLMESNEFKALQESINLLAKQMQKGLEIIHKRLDEHDQRFEEIQRSLVLIENQVMDKIPALFDGYNANHENYEELKKRVDELESRENLNSIKISILEDKIG